MLNFSLFLWGHLGFSRNLFNKNYTCIAFQGKYNFRLSVLFNWHILCRIFGAIFFFSICLNNEHEYGTMLFYLVTVGACLLCRVSPVVPWNKKVFVSCCTRPQLDSLNYDGVHCALLRQKSWWAGPLILTYPLLFSFGRG